MTPEEISSWLVDSKLSNLVQKTWDRLGDEFLSIHDAIPSHHRMVRPEISFHEHVKLLGFLAVISDEIPGDILEIGIWKGKSLALMHRLTENRRKIFGIDPLELPKQAEELSYYHRAIYPDANVIRAYSERALPEVERKTRQVAILHIDGNHLAKNVLLDFLLYEGLVSPGGFIVFDDYKDRRYSPEVGPAVDLLRVGGLFKNYIIYGSVPGFENSYMIQRKGGAS